MPVFKIGFASHDGETISAHFGYAPLAVVVTLEDGQEIAREVREKGHKVPNDPRHTHDPHDKFAAVTDCDLLVAGGIGPPGMAYAGRLGIEVWLVAEQTVDEALRAYLDGTLTHDPARIESSHDHDHGHDHHHDHSHRED